MKIILILIMIIIMIIIRIITMIIRTTTTTTNVTRTSQSNLSLQWEPCGPPHNEVQRWPVIHVLLNKVSCDRTPLFSVKVIRKM